MLEYHARQYYLNAMGMPQWRLKSRADKTDKQGIYLIPSALLPTDKQVQPDREEPDRQTQLTESEQVLIQVTVDDTNIQPEPEAKPQADAQIDNNQSLIGSEQFAAKAKSEKNRSDSLVELKVISPNVKSSIAPVQEKVANCKIPAELEPQLDKLYEQVSQCQLCSNRLTQGQVLKTTLLSSPASATGNILLLLNEPSIGEYQQGSYLTEQYLTLLHAIFRAVNLNANIYISSLLKCVSSTAINLPDSESQTKETENCQDFLKQEIALLDIDIIVTLGLVPMQELTNNIEEDLVLEQLIGNIYELKPSLSNNKKVFITAGFHPGFLYRNSLFKPRALDSWIKIAKLIKS